MDDNVPVEDIKEFIRIDDGLKEARVDAKEARAALKAHKESIIDYMRKANVDRLDVKKGTQRLFLLEKTRKIRPKNDAIKAKLTELMDRGVRDPDVIAKEISECGGTAQVWTLQRRGARKSKQ